MTYRTSVSQKNVSKLHSVMAPVGGLNDQEPLAATPPEFCIELINWFPATSALVARKGYKEWATNFGREVKSILTYYDMSGVGKVFAVTDLAVYNITNSTSSPAIDIPVTDGDYKGVMFGTVANQYLVAVNGRGSPGLIYDGATWTEMTWVLPAPLLGEIEGVDPKLFSNVTTFKRRLWFVEKDSTTAWYLPTDALAGIAKPFYLGSIFRRGGKLLYIVDWSVDAGAGLDDKLVFVSDLGEMAIYKGSDPDDTNNWALDATFFASAPLGDRTSVDLGGDVLFSTAFGITQLSTILTGKAEITPDASAVSHHINRRLNLLATSKKYALNWQLFNLAGAQALMLNIPANGNSPAIQFVMNLLTGAWAEYDLPINCAGFQKGLMYFGTKDGRVCTFGDNNYLDNVLLDGTGGIQITCSVFTAFNYMDNPTVLKNWKMIRPLFQSDYPPNYVFKLNTDFALDPLTAIPAPPTSEALNPPLWDEAKWDEGRWITLDSSYRPWLGISGIGFSCALQMKVGVTSVTRLIALEYLYEEGGII